jgi:hypothetical protein
MDLLFVPIMPVGRDYYNNNLSVVNLVNEPLSYSFNQILKGLILA